MSLLILISACLWPGLTRADFEPITRLGGSRVTTGGTVTGLPVTVSGTDTSNRLNNFFSAILYSGTSCHDLNADPHSASTANRDSVGTEFMWGSLNPKASIPAFSFNEAFGHPDPKTGDCSKGSSIPSSNADLANGETVILTVTSAIQ